MTAPCAPTSSGRPALSERVDPFLEEGEAGFDFSLLQRVLGRMIAVSLDALIAADEAHFDELNGDVESRSLRGELVEAVRQKLIEVRRIVQGLFGAERALTVVPLDGATAEQPEHLWRQGQHTLHRLEDPDLQLPERSTSGVTFDPPAIAGELETLVSRLRETLDVVDRDRREADGTLDVKRKAQAEHDLLMSACGRILTGFLLLAGRTDLARKVRLSVRRGRGGEDAAGTEPSASEAPPSESQSEPADTGEPETE